MNNEDRDSVASFFSSDALFAGGTVTLPQDAAHHMRVARIPPGAIVGLTNGAGTVARGTLVKVSRTSALVDVLDTQEIVPPPALHLLAPVADRDRMLWLAEKATELGITSWRPVMWRRSTSVSPRGEGPMFQAKVKARMTSALLQSGRAWLPEIFPEASVERAVSAAPAGTRLILARDGDPIATTSTSEPVTIALGPEGGMEPDELNAFFDGGFRAVRLSDSTLRFETAGIAAIAVAVAQLSHSGNLIGEA